ncbi:MAG: ATP-binding protein [Flavobacteriaceae bacterium]|nr:ATP-binding protein [Flavobacteriaceae bacterium]
MQQKIVISGGPGSGKTTVINQLRELNYNCINEVSRQIILDAQKKGTEQLFLKDPLLFSKMLLIERERQYIEASETKHNLVFFDRGIPDIIAYMEFKQTKISELYDKSCIQNRYSTVFLMPPWEEIYLSDNERYESYEESMTIYKFIKKTYIKYNYQFIEVPFGTVKMRTQFILNSLVIK